MSIPDANIKNTGSLAKMLVSIKTAGVPDRVTAEFLKTLGFKSSNDRPIISVLKGIGFLDGNGTPTERYRAYRSNESKRVLATALREAYSDIFLANTKAHALPLDKLKGIIASKTTKGEAVVERIARTFQVMVKAADWSEVIPKADDVEEAALDEAANSGVSETGNQTPPLRVQTPSFHYNLEIHLPTTTDVTVYNAIFKSMRDNLL